MFKAIPSAGKVKATVVWRAGGGGCRRGDSRRHYSKWSNHYLSFLYIQTYTKSCRSVSGEFNLTRMLLKSTFNIKTHKHTQVSKHRK